MTVKPNILMPTGYYSVAKHMEFLISYTYRITKYQIISFTMRLNYSLNIFRVSKLDIMLSYLHKQKHVFNDNA